MTDPSVRRQKVIALVLSGVFPGLGQFYNRQPGKGAAFLAAGLVLSWVLSRAVPTAPLTLNQPEADLIVPLCALLLVWLWSILDAWHGTSDRCGFGGRRSLSEVTQRHTSCTLRGNCFSTSTRSRFVLETASRQGGNK